MATTVIRTVTVTAVAEEDVDRAAVHVHRADPVMCSIVAAVDLIVGDVSVRKS